MAPTRPDHDTLPGFLYALAAYLMWGFLPFYMKAVADIFAPEVVAHRIFWSLPIALAVLAVTGRLHRLVEAIRSPQMFAMAAIAATLISVNWGMYVWAIGAGHAVDIALGYYINPLFSVFLGATLLGERLHRTQVFAIGLAAAAVAILTIAAGHIPLVALGITVTWGFYAYFKRRLPIGANEGFALEILILSPFALGYLVWRGATGVGHFGTSAHDTLLLLASGLVTAIPLMSYANGAKGLRLSTIGIMQYIAPSMILAIALVFFHESFSAAEAIAFPLIWLALAVYTVPMLRLRAAGRAI